MSELLARARTAAPATATVGESISSRQQVISREGQTPRLKLVLRAERAAIVLFAFAGNRLILGRDAIDESLNDVCLRVRGPGGDDASRKIASRHLGLEASEAGVTVVDFGSRTGTRLDGVRLPPKAYFGLRPLARSRSARRSSSWRA